MDTTFFNDLLYSDLDLQMTFILIYVNLKENVPVLKNLFGSLCNFNDVMLCLYNLDISICCSMDRHNP